MSYYEIAAEGSGYSYFQHRKISDTLPHFHGAAEFVFVEKGEIEAVVNGEKLSVKAGYGLFSDSFSVHAYYEKGDNSGFVLLGDKEIFNRYFSLLGGAPETLFRFDRFDVLLSLFDFYSADFGNEKDKKTVFDGSMGVLLGIIAETSPFKERKKNGSSLVTDILLYCENHYAEDLSLACLAKKFGYTEEHLSRLLHKYLFENWHSYIGRLRAKKVRFLMERFPEESALKLAFDCGFQSSNTFYRAYSRAFGETPEQSRENIKK